MEASVEAVEEILKYKFSNKELLEEALTHPSWDSNRYFGRLEFFGDPALGLAFSKYALDTYKDADQGKLVLVRSANLSTETLARVAVRHGLYQYLRRNDNGLDGEVKEFEGTVSKEDEREIHGGLGRAPKVLANMIEALAAAVYVDCDFNLKRMWEIIKVLLGELITLDDLGKSQHPVTQLYELCQKDGKKCSIHYLDGEDGNFVARVTVEGLVIGSASSNKKRNAKFNAAKAALQKLQE